MKSKPDIESVADILMKAPIGKYIGKSGAKILAGQACYEEQLGNNEFLFHEGDMGTAFYIVLEGRLALVKEKKDENPRILHVLEEGDLVGELCFIDDTPHTTSIMALGDVSLLCFKSDGIQPLITEQPKLMYDFMRAIITRVHHTATDIAKQEAALSTYISSNARGRL